MMRSRERQLREVVEALWEVLTRAPQGARLLRRVPGGLRAAASAIADEPVHDLELDLTILEEDLGPGELLSVFDIRSKEGRD